MPGNNTPISLYDYPEKLKPAITRWRVPGWQAHAIFETVQLNANQIVYQPIFVSEPTTFIRVAVKVITSKAGETLDLRLFEWNNGVPGALIEDFGNVSLAAVAIVEIVINRLLPRGYYFLARRTTSAVGGVLAGIDVAQGFQAPGLGIASACGGAFKPILTVTAAWADPAPAPTGSQYASECAIYLREN